MAKSKGDYRVLIPASAVEPKPWYRKRPNDAVIRSIKDHIRETGNVLTCEEVTFSKPEKDSEMRYIGEFELPERYIRQKLFAPCPICTTGHRKFGHGKIAWFPEEGLIRLIGPDCYKTLNSDTHEQALVEYRREIRRKNAVRYLLGQAPLLRLTGVLVTEALLQAEAIDDFGAKLRHKTELSLNMGLWNSVRTGELSVWSVFRNLDGRTGDVRELTAPKVYARLDGVHMLNPKVKSYTRELKTVISALAQLDDLDRWRHKVDQMPDAEKFEACRLISKTVGTAKRLFDEMRELQRFVEPENINTLRSWGAREDCGCPTFIRRAGLQISIGRNPAAMLHLMIPPHFSDPLGSIEAPTLQEFEREDAEADDLADVEV